MIQTCDRDKRDSGIAQEISTWATSIESFEKLCVCVCVCVNKNKTYRNKKEIDM